MVLSSRSVIEPLDPGDIPLWVEETFMVQYFQVTIVTMLVFDARKWFFVSQVSSSANVNFPSSYYL